MNYQQAWEALKSQLLARGEYFFFAQGDDPNSIYKLGEVSIQTTLKQMEDLEKKIKNAPVIHLPVKDEPK